MIVGKQIFVGALSGLIASIAFAIVFSVWTKTSGMIKSIENIPQIEKQVQGLKNEISPKNMKNIVEGIIRHRLSNDNELKDQLKGDRGPQGPPGVLSPEISSKIEGMSTEIQNIHSRIQDLSSGFPEMSESLSSEELKDIQKRLSEIESLKMECSKLRSEIDDLKERFPVTPGVLPEPLPMSSHSVEEDNFFINLQECKRGGEKISCFLLITNKDKKRHLTFHARGTRIFYGVGEKLQASLVTLGNDSHYYAVGDQIPRDATVKFNLQFQGVDSSINAITILEIQMNNIHARINNIVISN